jgi:DNA processing protein
MDIFTLNILKLKLVPYFGDKTIFRLIEQLPQLKSSDIDWKDIENSVTNKQRETLRNQRSQIEDRLDDLINHLDRNHINVITFFDTRYPESLKSIFDPPVVLFIKGESQYEYNMSIAVVGTRKYTKYGHDQCLKFCTDLARHGFTIISGLASGIDSIAHQTALDNNAKCIGVLGSGFDYVYPSTNARLYETIIAKGGCLITEYLPYQAPDKRFFPARNRLIAGLSRGTLIVEAASKSGSLITANFAFEQGKFVYAIPADIIRVSSQGCNDLIKNNIASLVTDAEDILKDYGFARQKNNLQSGLVKCEDDLNENESAVYDLICKGPYSTDELIELLSFEPSQLMPIITTLELKGLIRQNDYDSWSPVIR